MLRRLLEKLRGLMSANPPEPPAARPPDETEARREKDRLVARLYELAKELELPFEMLAHPSDLGKSELYLEAARILEREAFSTAEVCTFAVGDNNILNCVALDALRLRRDESFAEPLIGRMTSLSSWGRWILCELLGERHPAPVLERFLRSVDSSWQSPMARQDGRARHARAASRGAAPAHARRDRARGPRAPAARAAAAPASGRGRAPGAARPGRDARARATLGRSDRRRRERPGLGGDLARGQRPRAALPGLDGRARQSLHAPEVGFRRRAARTRRSRSNPEISCARSPS